MGQTLLGGEFGQALAPRADHCFVTPQLLAQEAEVESVRHTGWVRDLLGKAHRAASVLSSSLGKTQKPQVDGAQRRAADTWVVPTIGEGVCGVLCGAVQGKTTFNVLPASGELAEPS